MDIESSRLIIEPVTLDDGQMLIRNPMEYYYSHQIPYELDWPHDSLKVLLPLYLEDLENDDKALGYGPWIIKDKYKGNIIGEIGFNGFDDHENTLELGYQIIEKYQGAGYATEAVEAICQWAFYQGVKKITACCDKENKASQKVLKHNGFKKVGNEKGILIYEKLRKVYEKNYQSTNS
ncbi:GNAT family N-acetyltransferase [Sediminibacillus massiliensis]|uniref:GNAT family N-acetyltransferase n=1 Tax=Sediminibacillus massiliensis TaxID=1926277 RepID=UPI00098840C4|nr:GNAT family N-acetyltransferase [Sediminibacillus massiliensis]